MAPPPATPASSSKFLLSKRQPSQSQQHITPSQSAGGPRQFNATPRFSVPSTPRAASSQAGQFATPAVLPPRVSSTRGRATQDLIDVESSPESSDPVSPSDQERYDVRKEDDLITSFVSEYPSQGDQNGRSPKRRRISISPVLESSPPHGVHTDTLTERLDIDVDPSFQSSDGAEDAGSSSESNSFRESDDGHGTESPVRPASPHRFLFQAEPQTQAQARQPFKPPPQFKQPSATTSLQPQYPLPDAFSPQRRGAKYVNGGLAGELRDWLVDVKGISDAPEMTTGTSNKAANPPETPAARQVHVDDVRRGTGFCLVSGSDSNGVSIHMVLAGDGRLSGLAERRNIVRTGCAVIILPPMWDIQLDEQKWMVACDWYVADDGG